MAPVLWMGLFFACTSEPGGEDTVAGPSGGATITLTAPVDGEGSYTGDFTLGWDVEGLALDEDIGGEARPGHGHVHVYVDDELVEETSALGADVLGLSAGTHSLRVRLASNDHQELDATDVAEVEVRKPSVRLTAPTDGEVLTASSVPLLLAVEGFAMADTIGGEDVFGEGYFRVLVDGNLRDWGNDPLTAVATGLTEGRRTLTVELVRRDGRPLDPPVSDTVEVEVPVGVRGVYWDRSAFATVYDSATLPIALTTTAFTLYDRELGRPPVDGEGHLHLFFDGVWLDATAEPARVLQNVAPGEHLLEARLVTNDGFELPILDRMWVNVAPDRPDVVVTYPGPDWILGPAFDLTFTAENFTLDAGAAANAPHVGVAQVLVDGVLVAESAEPTVPLSGLLPGTHTLRVQLANADRTPVSPAVYAEFPVVVE